MLTLKEAITERELADSKEIRRKVFVEEQGVDESVVFSDSDVESMYVIMYDGAKPVATGSLKFEKERWMIRSLAVVKEERKTGLGDFLMRYLIRRAFELGASETYLFASAELCGFYSKLGFERTNETCENKDSPCILMKRAGDIGGHCSHSQR